MEKAHFSYPEIYTCQTADARPQSALVALRSVLWKEAATLMKQKEK